ncbi:hypothetical protein BDQ17DRAFT_1492983 [Cyathus striatus]|nr:hypothetical protein BDQ17DRAFT_1492983 [Cyathus striatus]
MNVYLMQCTVYLPANAHLHQNNHQRNCIHKTPPDGVSKILWFLQNHHNTLDVYSAEYKLLKSKYDTAVYLTPPLQHSGLSTSTDKVTLLKIYYSVDTYTDIQFEAVIYRAITEEGKSMLEKMQINFESSKGGIKPYSESLNEVDVQVVKNPLTGKASWFVKNIPDNREPINSDNIFWFNCPTSPSNSITQDNIDDATTEGLGIGFISSLLPGDHIAIIGKSEIYGFITAGITLYTDAMEKYSLAN